MSKKRGDVSPGVEEAPQDGVPLAELSEPIPVDAPEPAHDPFRGKRGKSDPATRAQYWVVGLDPSNGTVRVLWKGKTRRAANKWSASVRMILAGTWAEVRLVRVKPVSPAQWGDD